MYFVAGEINEDELKEFRTQKMWLYKYNPTPSVCSCRARHWTIQAFECYASNKDCKKCAIKTLYGIDDCLMYLSVCELLVKFGQPTKELMHSLYGDKIDHLVDFLKK